MPTCPICGNAMAVDRVVSVAGVQDKTVSWLCPEDAVVAEGVHPVQISHLRVGEEGGEPGHRARIIKLEMLGAELLVFRQAVGPAADR